MLRARCLLGTLAGRASTLLEGGDARLAEPKDGNETEEQASQQRDHEREEQDDAVDLDFVEARQTVGRRPHQQRQAAARDRDAEHAAEQPERDAFRQQRARDLAAAGAKRRADGKLLVPALRAHETQIRDVRARDEQHHPDRAEQDPQHLADIADGVLDQRIDIGRHLQVVIHLAREARRQREVVGNARQQAANVGVGLLQRHAGLEACHPL